MFVGYLSHLLLDEVFSVDLMGRRIKASFGSAMKFYDGRNIGDTSLVAVLTVIAFLLAPPSDAFVKGITSPQLWTGLHQRLLPQDNWFGLGEDSLRLSDKSPLEDTSKISTGSVAPPAEPAGSKALLPDR